MQVDLESPTGASGHADDTAPPVASVEIDRYCEGCGYNLRTQPVRRDERTQILLVRCPECGRFASAADGVTAARPWLHRLATLALFMWVFALLWLTFVLSLAHGGVSRATLEALTSRTVTYSVTQTGAGPLPPIPPFPATIPAATPTTAPTPTRTRVTVSSPMSGSERTLFLIFVLGLSAVIGFVTSFLAVVACHHWKRWHYVFPAALIPFVVGAIVYGGWQAENPELAEWSLTYIGAHAACHLAGGILAVIAGRAFARMLVCLLLPPRVRPALGFLWLADKKPLPAAA